VQGGLTRVQGGLTRVQGGLTRVQDGFTRVHVLFALRVMIINKCNNVVSTNIYLKIGHTRV